MVITLFYYPDRLNKQHWYHGMLYTRTLNKHNHMVINLFYYRDWVELRQRLKFVSFFMSSSVYVSNKVPGYLHIFVLLFYFCPFCLPAAFQIWVCLELSLNNRYFVKQAVLFRGERSRTFIWSKNTFDVQALPCYCCCC